ncbi:MAG: T9SS type A sorting domain-containing protein [Bacteroidetes bacterium]|nr:MAG: T9SS type A sorting domain-containing protein [Bacteroidota bacterium]
MKRIILVLFFVVLSRSSFSQIRRDAIWCFGDSVLVDFNYSPPLLDYCATRSRGSACSIADSSGNLLFYAHTYYYPRWQNSNLELGAVWNRNHQLMENGDSLIGRVWYKEMVIVPNPALNNKYYLFHTDVAQFRKLYYSVIDLSYNAGLGKITQKNVLIDSLPNRGITDGIVAVKHGNGRDWWVLFRLYNIDGSIGNSIGRILISPAGPGSIIEQNIGLPTYSNITRLYFNHAGNNLALINVAGLVEYYDFDRCTGQLSNLRTLHMEEYNAQTFYINYNWSAEFSENDSVLYVSTNDPSVSYLYQYDLSATNISNSRLLIDSLNSPGNGGELKLAADGKIYWAGAYYNGVNWPYPYDDSVYNQYNMNLSVISSPNQIGQACDFQRYSFYLGGHRSYLGLPNNPNYDLIAKGGTLCDTLGFPNAIYDQNIKSTLQVFPNPASTKLALSYEAMHNSNAEVIITDVTGRVVLQQILNSTWLEISSLTDGIYLLHLYFNNQFYSAVKFTVLK